MKKRIVLIAVIIMAIVAATMIYQTFATDSGTSSYNVYDITFTSLEKITIPAGTNKTYYYQITNTNKGVVQYGVVYSGDNITVKVYDDSDDTVSGTIDYGENKFVKLYVENTGTSDSTASIKTVLGYENGGALEGTNIVPEDHEFVTEVYSDINCENSNTLMCNIINLYANNNPTLITHKDVNGSKIADYYYASSVNLMNDGLNNRGVFLKAPIALANGTKGNIRYYGANPNNYIYFNCDDYSNQSDSTCEKWRIIGIVDGKVKIIRDESIGDYSWDYNSDGSYDNNWHDSTLQVLLNNGYYNNKDGVIYYYNVDWEITPKTINFKTDNKGIKNDKSRNMISESDWYLGSYYDVDIFSNDIYKYERGNIKCDIDCTYDTTWTGMIGLMYPSDYGYAADLSMCNQTLRYYDNTNCTSNDWLFNEWQWFITPGTLNYIAWSMYINGSFNSYEEFETAIIGVRPTLYLDPELTLKNDGDGSSGNPYQIDVE